MNGKRPSNLNPTPGPWEVVNHKGVYAESGREIIYWAHNTRSGNLGEAEANARLIAEAPAMLEALLEALPYVEEGEKFNAPYKRKLSREIWAILARLEVR